MKELINDSHESGMPTKCSVTKNWKKNLKMMFFGQCNLNYTFC